jgi:hypothetical protein
MKSGSPRGSEGQTALGVLLALPVVLAMLALLAFLFFEDRTFSYWAAAFLAVGFALYGLAFVLVRRRRTFPEDGSIYGPIWGKPRDPDDKRTTTPF